MQPGRQHRLITKVFTAALVAALPIMLVPVSAQPLGGVTGTVFLGGDGTPLSGARVHLVQVGTRTAFASDTTGGDGAFDVSTLPLATYEAAVEYEGGLYVVETPVVLSEGASTVLDLAVSGSAPSGPAVAGASGGAGALFSGPLATTLVVVGAAISVGALVQEGSKSVCEKNPGYPGCTQEEASPF